MTRLYRFIAWLRGSPVKHEPIPRVHLVGISMCRTMNGPRP